MRSMQRVFLSEGPASIFPGHVLIAPKGSTRDEARGARMKSMSWQSTRSRLSGVSVRLAILIGLLGIFTSSASPAFAAKVYFGTQEYLHHLQDVAIKGPHGEALYLGYKYSFYSFVAPYRLSDDGYVLGVKGQDSFHRLDKAEIERFQARGLLPNPLPPYQLSMLDYAMGHLLWGLLVFIAGLFALGLFQKRRRRRALPYFGRALEHAKTGNSDQAIADYTKAIEIDPNFEAALINRGAMYRGKGDYDRAIADFTKAAKSKEVAALALINRGITHEKKGDFDRAIADHTQAVKVSKAPLAYYNRGNAFAGKGDYARAIVDYTKTIELEPNAEPAYRGRAAAYDAQGDTVQAQADYKTAQEIGDRQRAAPESVASG